MMTAEQLTMVTTGVSRRSKVTNCTIIIIIIIINIIILFTHLHNHIELDA